MKKVLGILIFSALFLPSIASAARLDTIGNETGSMVANQEYTLNGVFGAPDGASVAQVHSGGYSLYFGEKTTANFSWMAYKFRSAATAASTTVRAYVYLNQTFSAAQELMTLSNEGPGSDYSLRLNASNQLCMFDSVPTQIGSCTTITTGVWHYIELSTNGASTEIGRLDGVQFAASVSVTGAAISRVYFGCAFSATCKSDTYFDDEAVNDSTGSSQTSWAGAGYDIRLSPNAAGDVNTFATQTGGVSGSANNYTRVAEVTPDSAVTFNGSATLNQEDLFNVTNSGIGSSDTVTLVEYHDWFRASVASAEATFKPEIEKAAAGTISQGTAVTPTSVTFAQNTTANPNLPGLTLYNDPNGSPWTQTTLDSMQIGYKVTTGSTNRDDLSTAWVYAEYIPASTCGAGIPVGSTCVVTLTANPGSGTQTWTVPPDWNNSNNQISCIGSGGTGATAVSATSGAGGGAGAYASTTNVTLSGSATFSIGASATTTGVTPAVTLARETFFNGAASSTASLFCDWGNTGGSTATSTAGSSTRSIGTTKFSGGDGAPGIALNNIGGGGGGGSAGPVGIGQFGVKTSGVISGGTGGGGSDGGSSSVGLINVTTTGGNGGNGTDGTGSGIAAANLQGGDAVSNKGGGGAGGSGTGHNGGAGSIDTIFNLGHGAGGGGGSGTGGSAGAASGGNGGAGGVYGGGGGGGGSNTANADGIGGIGGQGLIVIIYTPTQASAGIPESYILEFQ